MMSSIQLAGLLADSLLCSRPVDAQQAGLSPKSRALPGMQRHEFALAELNLYPWPGMCVQVMQLMDASPFQEDAVHLPDHLLAHTVTSGPGPGAWAGPGPDLRQLGVELQWKHSSLNSTDSAACNFALPVILEPRVRMRHALPATCFQLVALPKVEPRMLP